MLWGSLDLFLWNKNKDWDLTVITTREFACPRTQKMPGTSKGVRQLDAFMSVLFDAEQ